MILGGIGWCCKKCCQPTDRRNGRSNGHEGNHGIPVDRRSHNQEMPHPVCLLMQDQKPDVYWPNIEQAQTCIIGHVERIWDELE